MVTCSWHGPPGEGWSSPEPCSPYWSRPRARRPRPLARNGRLPVGSDPFRAGQPYRGDFPDPTVWRVGQRYYAASTTVAALNLPVTSSTDLRTWTAAPASDPAKPRLNDAMPTPAALGQTAADRRADVPGPRPGLPRWRGSAPAAFVLAYSVPRASDGRRCISLARSAAPLGPYVDSSRAPLTCGAARCDRPADLPRPRGDLDALQDGGHARPAPGAPDEQLRDRLRRRQPHLHAAQRRARPGRARSSRTPR